MSRAFEWLAAALVCVGVNAMITSQGYDGAEYVVTYALGIVALTCGVRLAIDAARMDRP